MNTNNLLHELAQLQNNDGMTLKKYNKVRYTSGWQVATEGETARTPEKALSLIEEYKGTCGVWYSNGIDYIDKSHRTDTKREAMRIGKQCNQLSILKWATMECVML